MIGFFFNRPMKRKVKLFLKELESYPTIQLPHAIGLDLLSDEQAQENIVAWRAMAPQRADLVEALMAKLGLNLTWNSELEILDSQEEIAKLLKPLFKTFARSFKDRKGLMVRLDHMSEIWSENSPPSISVLLDLQILIAERYNTLRGGTQYWDYSPLDERSAGEHRLPWDYDQPWMLDSEYRDIQGSPLGRWFGQGFAEFFVRPLSGVYPYFGMHYYACRSFESREAFLYIQNDLTDKEIGALLADNRLN